MKITFGITILGLCGFNIAMNYPDNEILIGATLLICGGAGTACMPLTNELIVDVRTIKYGLRYIHSMVHIIWP